MTILRAALSVTLAGLAACAPTPRPPAFLLPGADVAPPPLPAGENISVTPLHGSDHASVAAVQIRDREPPHVHTRYDLTVVLARGAGTLWLAGVARPMRAGDGAFIPKGTPHYFVNDGDSPALALVVFAPPFSGPDQAPAP